MARIDELLGIVRQRAASDLHLAVGSPPVLRRHGQLEPLDRPPMSAPDLEALLFEIMTPLKLEEFKTRLELDFAYEAHGIARFRVNVFMHEKGIGAALRLIPGQVVTAEALDLPDVIRRLAEVQNGLVLVTGPTGSGKTTTMAAIIDLINRSRAQHIITIEDPIEYTHSNKRSLVNQREVGTSTRTFAGALRAALREDPDVILVGEMRDLESIRLGLTAAETGQLVLSTLHTNSAAKTVDRIVDVFDGDQQPQIRSMLADTLRAVIAQQLLLRADGQGLVAGFEILVVTPAVANLIREGKTHQIPNVMQTGKRAGMMLMDQAILELVTKNVVTAEEGHAHAFDKAQLTPYLRDRKLLDVRTLKGPARLGEGFDSIRGLEP